jgi:hypothetical protein
MKAALVTPCLPHLPLHPSYFLGYGSAILADKYDLEVIDLNAELHFSNREKLTPILSVMDTAQLVSDVLHLYPFHDEVDTHIDRHYKAISWKKYPLVYVTPPSWFPMVETEEVLRLSRVIKEVSPETIIFFFGNSLASWTNEVELKEHGVQTVHLNDPFEKDAIARPVRYDLLPNPVYEHRDKYLFDLLPFTLKHGCSWERCRFCSLSKGWHSGYLVRSAKTAIEELEVLIGYFEGFNKPWCGQSRADLSEKKIKALWKAGCRAIYFGLESGSDRTLRAMNKGITSKQMSNFIKRLHSSGIFPVPSLIIGAPGEGDVDFEQTIQFLVEHRPYLDVVNVYPFMLTPASEFSSENKQPDENIPMRMFRFIQTCEDLGLKIIFGEQSIEYFIFKRICKDRLACY